MKLESKFMITEIVIFSIMAIFAEILARIYGTRLIPSGSIITVSFIPIIIMSFRWRKAAGFLTGFITGLGILLFLNKNNIALSSLFIYPLGYGFLSFSAIVKENFIAKKANRSLIIIISVLIGYMAMISVQSIGLIFNNTNYINAVLHMASKTIPSLLITIILASFMVNSSLFMNPLEDNMS